MPLDLDGFIILRFLTFPRKKGEDFQSLYNDNDDFIGWAEKSG